MARMIRRFNKGEKGTQIDAIMEVKDPEMIYEIVRGIFYGIAKGLEEVDLFEVQVGDENKVFSVSRDQWEKALNKCLEGMIEIEDYETCSEIKKALSIVSRNI
jgi:hypothetical protein